jgi:hypothetical protein
LLSLVLLIYDIYFGLYKLLLYDGFNGLLVITLLLIWDFYVVWVNGIFWFLKSILEFIEEGIIIAV